MKGTPVEIPLAHAVPLSRYLLFFSIAGLGCGLDLWTKHAVFQWRGMPKPGNEWWLWEGYVGIETALNHGALFGMGQGLTWVFAVLSVLAVAGIVYWLFFAGAARDLVLTISLAAVTAGILGNLYDRLGLWGGPNCRRPNDLRRSRLDLVSIRQTHLAELQSG